MKTMLLSFLAWMMLSAAGAAQGRDFHWHRVNGDPIVATLLAVRDSDFVLAPATAYLGRGEYERASIIVLRKSDVSLVDQEPQGWSRAGFTLFGVATGGMLGVGIGAASTKTPSGDFGEHFATSISNSIAMVALPVLGAVLGGIVGYMTSAPPERIECRNDTFETLREHAVFVDRDPEALRAFR